MTTHRKETLLTFGTLAVAAVVTACATGPSPTGAPTATPTLAPDYFSELVRAVERSTTQALLDPRIIQASEADLQFDATEPVLVVAVNGEERAYSLIQMGIHEVVNDELGGVPIAVTW